MLQLVDNDLYRYRNLSVYNCALSNAQDLMSEIYQIRQIYPWIEDIFIVQALPRAIPSSSQYYIRDYVVRARYLNQMLRFNNISLLTV